MVIVLGVIAVAGGRDKNGIEINHLDPQGLKVIKLVQNALKVAAVKMPEILCGGERLPIVDVEHAIAVVAVFPGFHVVVRIAIGKTIGKNLILDGAFGPLGHMKAGDDFKSARRIRRRLLGRQSRAGFGVVDVFFVPSDDKGINHRIVIGNGNVGLKPVE